MAETPRESELVISPLLSQKEIPPHAELEEILRTALTSLIGSLDNTDLSCQAFNQLVAALRQNLERGSTCAFALLSNTTDDDAGVTKET